jgi:hypothetical protein
MPKYEYEPITTFLKPTTWSEDVSHSVSRGKKREKERSSAKAQIKGSFGLLSDDWKSFKQSISGMYSTVVIPNSSELMKDLSAECSPGEMIKVIFLARHGHG